MNGKVKIADDFNLPDAGLIHFDAASQAFEGFDGNSWIRLSNPKKEIFGLSLTMSDGSFSYDANDTEANNCSCFLNNAGDITRGTRIQIRLDSPQSGMPTGYIVNYANNIACNFNYRIICEK